MSTEEAWRFANIVLQILRWWLTLQSVADLVQGISVLTRSFIERFPPRPKRGVRRVLEFCRALGTRLFSSSWFCSLLQR